MARGAFAMAQERALDFRPLTYMGEYLEELDAQGRNPDYVRQVRSGLSHFADFCRTEGILHPAEIQRLHLIRFQGHVNDKVTDGTWSKSYGVQIMKKVRAWLGWMERVKDIPNAWVSIKVGTVVKEPRPLDDVDFAKLFAQHTTSAFTLSPFMFHRREIILTLLYFWGLRIHELEAMNVEDLALHLDFVVVKNKGGSERTKTLPYTPAVKKIVQRWLAQRARYAKASDRALVITESGDRMAITKIRSTVTDLGRECDVKVNPHRLRDTCATHLLDSDAPIERVQAILGHTNREQTLRYAKVRNQKVYETQQAAMDPRIERLFGTFRNTRDLSPST